VLWLRQKQVALLYLTTRFKQLMLWFVSAVVLVLKNRAVISGGKVEAVGAVGTSCYG
jgi:hypothetical protein